MQRTVESMIGYKLRATDDDLGKVKDLYFDDVTWTVRYIEVDAGSWLSQRRVLISPVNVGDPDWARHVLPVALTKEQVKESPPAGKDKPVSRQFEAELSTYYGWPQYWAAPPPGGIPAQTAPAVAVAEREEERDEAGFDPHLRSSREICGYHIKATDDEIGHVEDLIVDTDAWMIRYLVVDTRNWLPGRKVLVARQWAHSIEWNERRVHVDLSRSQIKDSPKFDPTKPINRQYEAHLYDYYGRPAYWNNKI